MKQKNYMKKFAQTPRKRCGRTPIAFMPAKFIYTILGLSTGMKATR